MGTLPIVVLLFFISSFVRSLIDNSGLNQVNREVQLFLLLSLSCMFSCVLCTFSPINPNSSPLLSFVCTYTQSIDLLKRFPVWKLLETELCKLNESIWTARK